MRFLKGKKVFLAVIGLAVMMTLVIMFQPQAKNKSVSAETLASGQTQAFINQIAGTASQIAAERDLYASVMIAQAVLESSSGQSGLSQAPYYNFFWD